MRRPSTARTTTILLASSALLAGLTGCGSGSDSDSADGGGTLEVWTRSGPEAAATYERVFEAFTEETGIQVDYQAVQEFDTQIQSRAAARDLPDVFINDSAALGTYVSQGWVVPVDPESISGHDLVSDANWDVTVGLDGEHYGIPFSRQAFVTFVRKDWREQLGLPVPETWDDISALADAFATEDPDGNGDDDTYGMVVPGSTERGYLAWWASSYIWQGGGDFVTSTGDGTYEAAFDSSGTREAVSWIQEQFCTTGHVQPGALTATTADSTQFVEGRAGIYVTGPYNFASYDEQLGSDLFEVIPTPAGPGGTATLAEGENVYLAAGSDMTEEQQRLAEYLISADAQRIAMAVDTTDNSQPVVRLPVNTDLDAGELRDDERWNLVQEQYDTDVRTFPSAIDFTPVKQAVAEGLNILLSDCGNDVGEAVTSINEAITAELEAQDVTQ
ncbi:extracellular solute-binding protein [Streptomyces sp. 8K308]|uniref:ABC transporter substrate-binding protein n=1 Tax=Streptomyces sp. 8K308 TaxID=2530388 RepID=UPI00104BEB96|nr:sugar ABC transporter substrate-binding protein [Streptomyces sp. 8K308]TDC19847.1 extracellular solute-binding protein [Streptomyces sp. 8K308]